MLNVSTPKTSLCTTPATLTHNTQTPPREELWAINRKIPNPQPARGQVQLTANPSCTTFIRFAQKSLQRFCCAPRSITRSNPHFGNSHRSRDTVKTQGVTTLLHHQFTSEIPSALLTSVA